MKLFTTTQTVTVSNPRFSSLSSPLRALVQAIQQGDSARVEEIIIDRDERIKSLKAKVASLQHQNNAVRSAFQNAAAAVGVEF